MAKSPANVQVTTITTGFGPYQLTNTTPAATGYRSIADAVADGSLSNGDTVHYVIEQNAAPTSKMFERGWGTINTSTLVLTVVSVTERSAALTSGGGWGAGTKDVFFAPPGAESVALLNQANSFTANQTVEGASPTLDFVTAGIIRNRFIYQANAVYWQYYSALFAIQGALRMTNGALDYAADGVTFKTIPVIESGRKVVQLVGGNVNKVPWYQATAPLGWTKDTSQNDKALRVVSGATGGTAGGSRVLSSAVVGGTSLNTGHMAAHSHDIAYTSTAVESNMPVSPISVVSVIGSGAGSGITSSVGSGTAHDHALALAYIDVIIASMD